jgi:hypothetical protein
MIRGDHKRAKPVFSQAILKAISVYFCTALAAEDVSNIHSVPDPTSPRLYENFGGTLSIYKYSRDLGVLGIQSCYCPSQNAPHKHRHRHEWRGIVLCR